MERCQPFLGASLLRYMHDSTYECERFVRIEADGKQGERSGRYHTLLKIINLM